MMKTYTLMSLAMVAAAQLFAGESMLTQTIQPLNGLGSGEIVIAPVTCHDWNALSGFPTAIGLITAKNTPPTNAPKPVEDLNVASASGLILTFQEDSAGRGIVTLDCRTLQVPQRLGFAELQVVGATLECLRQVAGAKLDGMTIRPMLKPTGQEAIQKVIEAFIKHPKEKPFPWQ